MKRFIVLLALVCFLLITGSLMASAASIPQLSWPCTSRTVILSFNQVGTFGNQCFPALWHDAGIDLGARAGDNVYAAEAGTVMVSQDSGTPWKEYIVIQHVDLSGRKYTTVYWHLAKRSVQQGASVKRGQKIAQVADMGSLTRLHFGIRNSSYTSTATLRGLPGPTPKCIYPIFPEFFVSPQNYLP
jgi:murein DD-endopeptidase MepM/ murein hydrolase activator NlpD